MGFFKTVVRTNKIGRNEPCPCGSGKNIKIVAQKSLEQKFLIKSSR